MILTSMVDISNGLLTSRWGTDKTVRLCRRLGKTEVVKRWFPFSKEVNKWWESLKKPWVAVGHRRRIPPIRMSGDVVNVNGE